MEFDGIPEYKWLPYFSPQPALEDSNSILIFHINLRAHQKMPITLILMEFEEKNLLPYFSSSKFSYILQYYSALTSFFEELLKEEHEGEVPVVLIVVRLHPPSKV